MRTLFAFFIIFLTAFNKSNIDSATGIEGTWELRRFTSGRNLINYPAANGKLLKFTNNTYASFDSGRVVKTGNYSIVADASAQASLCLVLSPGQYQSRIIFDNDDNGNRKFIQTSNDTLSIVSGCFATDAGSDAEYVKQ